MTDNELLREMSHVLKKVTDAHNSLLKEKLWKHCFNFIHLKLQGWMVFMRIKHDFISSCLAVLNDGIMPPRINDTLIVLLPKQKVAKRMEEFRPISLTTVISKTIAKAMANRLQVILPEVISIQQSAFIKGRLITDNFIIAHECAHFIKKARKSKQVFGSLKLDMSKAYDRIEWRFLKLILIQIGFAESWVFRILNYISSVRYSLRVTDSITSMFCPQRGLRQGDPLSPYLFILCTEWLSSKLNALHMNGRFSGLRIARHAPPLTHLLYADDCLLLFKFENNTANTVYELL
ncbi:hypothetical protein QQ045_027726 [Rhodiola kirilowii]